ncbi:MAG: tRNA (adenosine(37)-N6)-threonylcarbamoyltransferase complex ATPase subunit type 1 TsaE [Lachnospiraceae bacterium]|mgnify:CR=1 FL=1|nr:tRNA (adenosine(37)-N6)-threonylcarbamoyltransferase complex ATPase subunit type 1 TsaE [Lachnospiraceae bacterium]
MEYDSFNSDDTYNVAKVLGESARAGDVICLIGDLGVGKTLFSQGFAKGLEIEESVSSPTFTIVQQYDEGRLPLYHFDVYRIEDLDEMEEVGFVDMLYGDGVCLIEWADLISDILPEHYTRVTINKNLDRGFDYRSIQIENI